VNLLAVSRSVRGRGRETASRGQAQGLQPLGFSPRTERLLALSVSLVE